MKNNHLPYKILTILFLFFLTVSVYSQPVTWYRTWGLPGYVRSEQGKRVCQTFDGGYAVLAGVSNGSNEWFDILKYDYQGNLLWVKLITDSTVTGRMLEDMIQTSDSGFICAGWSSGALLIKADKNGNLIWQRNYPNLNPLTRFYSVQQTKDKGYIACGDYPDYSTSTAKGHVAKVDSLGYVEWEKWYLDSTHTYFNSIIQGFDRNYYIAGITANTQRPSYSMLKKLDSAGNVLNTTIFYQNSGCGFITQLKDSSIITGGEDNLTDYPMIVKYSPSCNIKWLKTYPSQYHFYFYYMSKDLFDNIILTGGFDKIKYAIIANWKIDTSGTVLKIKEVDYTGYSIMGSRCINPTLDSGYVLTGSITLLGYTDALIVKLDSGLNAPLISQINNKYEPLPLRFCVYQNYPNPFNFSTLIKFYLLNNGFTDFEIYDLVGKKVFSQKKYFYSGINKYFIDFNKYNLSSGIYFVRVGFESDSKLIKLVYLK